MDSSWQDELRDILPMLDLERKEQCLVVEHYLDVLNLKSDRDDMKIFVSMSEDDSVLMEVILPEKRLGFSIEVIPDQSGYYMFSMNDFKNGESGFLKDATISDVMIRFEKL